MLVVVVVVVVPSFGYRFLQLLGTSVEFLLGTCWGVSATDFAVGMGAEVHTRRNRRSRAAPARARTGTSESPGRAAACCCLFCVRRI